MKITKYFTTRSTWNKVEDACSELIEKREKFLSINSEDIRDIDSEDLKVEYIGNNSVICILRLTYL